ncbi:MAG: ECF transporter S component [Clostridiales bacterium]|nr:ECF transporter S component [Clostridiales bacterium]
MAANARTLSRKQIIRLTITGMLAALIIIMIYTPIGLLRLPGTSIEITLITIPVLIGLLAEGPLVGLILAFVFGAGTMLKGLIAPATPFDPLFINPLISVVPRLLIPIAAWGAFKLIRSLLPKKKGMDSIAWSVSALVGSLTNTVFVLLALFLVYQVRITEIIANIGLDQYLGAAGKFLFFGVALPNGIPEAIATMIIVPAVMVAVMAVKKQR